MRAREGGASTCICASGISAMASMTKGRAPTLSCNAKSSSGSDTTQGNIENEERGCARADSVGTYKRERNTGKLQRKYGAEYSRLQLRGGARRWGEDDFLSPNGRGQASQTAHLPGI